MTRRFSPGRLLVLAFFVLVIVSCYYFGVLRVPEAGGAEVPSVVA